MGYMFDLQKSILNVHNAVDEKSAFEFLNQALAEYGYTRNCYTLLTDHESLNLKAYHGLERSYPEEWMAYYNERNFYEVDPVRQRIFETQAPFYWSDVSDRDIVGFDAYLMMKQAEEAGIADGIGIGFHSGLNEITGIGIAREVSEKNQNPQDMANIYLLCSIFHERYRSLIEKPNLISLTNREIDVLCWASEGKTDRDISEILTISISTIRFHWKNIFFKLNANSRTFAISKALRFNLVQPSKIIQKPVSSDR